MATRILIQEYGTSNPIKLSDSQIRAIQPFLTFISLRAGSRNGEFTIEASSWVGDIKIPGLMISISPKIGPQNLLELLLMGDGEAKPRDTDSIIHRDETFWDGSGISSPPEAEMEGNSTGDTLSDRRHRQTR